MGHAARGPAEHAFADKLADRVGVLLGSSDLRFDPQADIVLAFGRDASDDGAFEHVVLTVLVEDHRGFSDLVEPKISVFGEEIAGQVWASRIAEDNAIAGNRKVPA